MKPFRLINASQIKVLSTRFEPIISAWNDEFALNPINFSLKKPEEDPETSSSFYCLENLALIESNFINFLNFNIFGEDHCDFDSSSLKIGEILWASLFEKELNIRRKNFIKSDWFYKGSSVLALNLEAKNKKLSLYLNPDWVFDQLKATKTNKPLSSLEKSIENQEINFEVLMPNLKLSLDNLRQLEVGDLLQTASPLDQRFKLCFQQNPLFEALLGKAAEHKSIVIKRSL